MAKISRPRPTSGKTKLGEYLEEKRHQTPGMDAQVAVARALRALDVDIADRSYASVENENRGVRPDVVNALPRILNGVTVLEVLLKMGYELTFEGIETEEEVEILEAYRSASDPQKRAVRGALLLPQERPTGELGRSLRRLAETGRRDRRGNLE